MINGKFKIALNVFTTVALLVLVYISRSQIAEAFRQLADLSIWLLLLQIPLQVASYNSVAHMYYSYFKNTGQLGELKVKEMYKVSLELNFVNSVFPSGGVSGFSYLSYRLKPFGVSTAASTLAQGVRFILTFVSFLIVLGFGLLFLAFDQQAGGLVILIGSSVFTGVITLASIAIYIVSDESRIKSFAAFLPKLLNAITKRLHLKKGKDLLNIKRIEKGLEELHERYDELKKDPNQLKAPFFYSLAINVFELTTIYMVYVAFGEFVNPGSVILAYAVANFAGLVAVLPGGVGIYEGLMATVLTATGVPQGLAISATLVYRVINLMIFVPVGYFFYHKAINNAEPAET